MKRLQRETARWRLGQKPPGKKSSTEWLKEDEAAPLTSQIQFNDELNREGFSFIGHH